MVKKLMVLFDRVYIRIVQKIQYVLLVQKYSFQGNTYTVSGEVNLYIHYEDQCGNPSKN